MRKIWIPLLLLFSLFLFPSGGGPVGDEGEADDAVSLYRELGLEGQVGFTAFEQALAGYRAIDTKRKEILTLIDFSKPSTDPRLWVLDIPRRTVLFTSHVAHGQNSGGNYATAFSNRHGSHQSSLGFFLTAGTYNGKNGYSLVLDGLEPGINDNARARAVVIHGAAYANPSVIDAQGRLGRSWGCPALPEALTRPVIDAIQGGSVLYIYADDQDYLAQSSVLGTETIAAL
jgi:hypothetical protein